MYSVILLFLGLNTHIPAASLDSVAVNANSKINKAIWFYRLINEQKGNFPGYRVQIHFGNDREKAMEFKTKFLKDYPEQPAYESYQSPNFRIRVGDFRTRLDALKFLKQISPQFPSSFIVSDQIHYPSNPPK